MKKDRINILNKICSIISSIRRDKDNFLLIILVFATIKIKTQNLMCPKGLPCHCQRQACLRPRPGRAAGRGRAGRLAGLMVGCLSEC